ncbi:MAG: hypothetical protein M3068_08065 [Gemmatimonadota bacterium]|nr:hypothetical protein [Gemmatimonadota bacterium]
MARGALVFLALIATARLAAQTADVATPWISLPPRASALRVAMAQSARAEPRHSFSPARLGPDPWWAPLVSAAVPGAGQAVLGQSRVLPYVGVEIFAWTEYLSLRRDGRNGRHQYQDLSRTVARSLFSDSLPNGDFEYYESMEHFVESGVFSQSAGGVVMPESDESTFNGTLWLLARRTFWEDPTTAPPPESVPYQRALEFYARRAVRPEYRWSWRNAQLEQDLFRRTIEESNDAFRSATQYLGLIIANHALSAVDAFVTLRLRRSPGPDHRVGFEGRLPWSRLGAPPASSVAHR